MFHVFSPGRTARPLAAWLAAWFVALAFSDARAQDAPPAPPGGPQVIKERYPNGAVQIERQVVQNENGDYVNDGLFSLFATNGTRLGGGNYILGKRDGVWKRWFYRADGPLFQEPTFAPFAEPFLSQTSFENDQIEGAWTILDRNKQRVAEWGFQGGKPHGVWTWYYPNGQKLREVSYIHGVPDGKVVLWGQNGKAGGGEEYVNGRLRKFEVKWYGPGQKSWQGWYLYPKEKTRTTYDWWNGAAATVVVGVEGDKVRDGKWTWWYPNGQIESEGAFVAGAKNGLWTWYHPNGQKMTEGDYVLDDRSGAWTWWTIAGRVEQKKAFDEIAAPPGEGESPQLVESALPDGNATETESPDLVEGANPTATTEPPGDEPLAVESATPTTTEASEDSTPAPVATTETEADPAPTPAPVPAPEGEPAPAPAEPAPPAPAEPEAPPAPAEPAAPEAPAEPAAPEAPAEPAAPEAPAEPAAPEAPAEPAAE